MNRKPNLGMTTELLTYIMVIILLYVCRETSWNIFLHMLVINYQELQLNVILFTLQFNPTRIEAL